MIVHHHPFLSPCRFVRLALAEHKIEPEYVVQKPWQADEAFLAANPAMILPMVYDDASMALCGATVIMEYLDERYGAAREHRLMPTDPFDRAEVRRLVSWFMHKFEDEVAGPLAQERILKVEMPASEGGGAPDSKTLRVARANVVPHLNYIGALLAERDFLAGERFSFADLAGAAALSVVDYLGDVPWGQEATVKAWYQKMKSRPTFRPLLADRLRLVPPSPHYDDLDF